MKRLVGAERRHATQGQALVEFALIAPLLFLLLFGIIQFGFLLAGQVGMTNAAREAARYASPVGSANYMAQATAARTDLVKNILPRSIIGYRPGNLVAANTQVAYCAYLNGNNTAQTPSYSLRVRVTIQYRQPIFFPVISNIVDLIDGTQDNALAATASEEMRLETLRLSGPPGGILACS